MNTDIQGEHKVFFLITNIYYKKTTWNTNIFFSPLLMLISKILCHVFIVMLQLHSLLVSKWRQWRRNTITEDMLENTWREIDYRLDVLRATNGAHVEVY